jgi:replicative DNA helicase
LQASDILEALACGRSSCECHTSVKRGHGLTHCVVHKPDNHPSLSVSLKDGNTLVHCQTGCAQGSVWAELRKMFPEPKDSISLPANPVKREEVAAYDYLDETGALLYQVVRYSPKGFSQRVPDGTGGWTYSLNGVRRVLYRLPELRFARDDGQPIYITEGEKDADAIVKAGYFATCSPQGAGKWQAEYAADLLGVTQAIIVQDKDEPGYLHAVDVAKSLEAVGIPYRVVEAITGKDAYDHLAAGHGVDDFAPAKRFQPEKPATTIWQDGATFIFDHPAEVVALWGQDEEVLMADGESLFIVGPQGVGKSTIAQQLMLGFAGLRTNVLGYPVQPATGNIFYHAADRPQQIRRSLRRMVEDHERDILESKLRFWPGPLHFNPLTEPEKLLSLLLELGCSHIFFDSLKDLAIGLNKDETAGEVNRLFQFLSAAGIQIVVIHHQRKAQGDNKKPNSISDVYGNQQLTAGSGSVILLWGEPGDSIIEFDHLKQPRIPVGPFRIVHHHEIGHSEIENKPADPLDILRAAHNDLTAEGVARSMFGTEKASKSQTERARRRLNILETKNLITSYTEPSGLPNGLKITRYKAL